MLSLLDKTVDVLSVGRTYTLSLTDPPKKAYILSHTNEALFIRGTKEHTHTHTHIHTQSHISSQEELCRKDKFKVIRRLPKNPHLKWSTTESSVCTTNETKLGLIYEVKLLHSRMRNHFV